MASPGTYLSSSLLSYCGTERNAKLSAKNVFLRTGFTNDRKTKADFRRAQGEEVSKEKVKDSSTVVASMSASGIFPGESNDVCICNRETNTVSSVLPHSIVEVSPNKSNCSVQAAASSDTSLDEFQKSSSHIELQCKEQGHIYEGNLHNTSWRLAKSTQVRSMLKASLTLSRWYFLVFFSIYATLIGPLYLNWAPLRQLLFDCAVYKWVCKVDVTDSESTYYIEPATGTCAQQRVRIGNLFTLCTVADYGMSFFGGLAMDSYGPKAASLAGTFIMLLGWLVLALSSETFHAFEAGFLIFGLGIDMAFYGTLTLGTLFPGSENRVRALLAAMRCASYLIPVLLQRLTARSGVSYQVVMLAFAGVAYTPALLIAGLFIPTNCWKYVHESEARPVTPTARRREAGQLRDTIELSSREHLSHVANSSNAEMSMKDENQNCTGADEMKRKTNTRTDGDRDRTEVTEIVPFAAAAAASAKPLFSWNRGFATSSSEISSPAAPTLKSIQILPSRVSAQYTGSLHSSAGSSLYKKGYTERRSVHALDGKGNAMDFNKDGVVSESNVFDGTPSQNNGYDFSGARHYVLKTRGYFCVPLKRSILLDTAHDFARTYLCSGSYFPLVPYFVITLLRAVYFNASSHDLVPHALSFLQFITGFVFFLPPLFGFVADRCGVIVCMVLTNSFGFLVVIGSLLIRPKGAIIVEYVVAILFMLTMSLMTNQMFFYVGDTFPPQHWGKLIGFACTVGGLLSLLALPMFRYSVNASKNNATTDGFRQMLLLLTALSLVSFVLLFVLYTKRRRAKNPAVPHANHGKLSAREERW